MGYQPKGEMKMSTKPPAPMPQTSRLARINDISEEDYIKTQKVVEVCNRVAQIMQREDLSLGDVIIWLSDKIDELVNSLQKSTETEKKLKRTIERSVTLSRLVELEDEVKNLEKENRNLKNEIVLLKAREKYEI